MISSAIAECCTEDVHIKIITDTIESLYTSFKIYQMDYVTVEGKMIYKNFKTVFWMLVI